MTVRLPGFDDEWCPKCHAMNTPPSKIVVWMVSDERGLHRECDACTHHWREVTRPNCSLSNEV